VLGRIEARRDQVWDFAAGDDFLLVAEFLHPALDVGGFLIASDEPISVVIGRVADGAALAMHQPEHFDPVVQEHRVIMIDIRGQCLKLRGVCCRRLFGPTQSQIRHDLILS
jgi:hypothetical protein